MSWISSPPPPPPPPGVAVFGVANLDFAFNSDRGPWSLPPGEYELVLRALPNAGEPAWQISSVVDEHAGPIGIDEVVVAEYPTPGSRLSYNVEPDEDGQALVFDLMSSATQNLWTLHDPVGTPVFGPANANNFSSHDQGPIPLAAGVYTLTFSNAQNQAIDWLFRVASSGTTIELPEGCAACSALDVVFTFDTSPSMDPVNQAMCDLTADLVQALADDGIPINSRFWGISDEGVATCLTSNVAAELGNIVPGSPPSFMSTLDQCDDGLAGPRENWGPAVALVASELDWDEDAVRLLIPVVDEGSYCGDPVNDFDIESVYYARQIAAQNDVVVSPLLPDIASRSGARDGLVDHGWHRRDFHGGGFRSRGCAACCPGDCRGGLRHGADDRGSAVHRSLAVAPARCCLRVCRWCSAGEWCRSISFRPVLEVRGQWSGHLGTGRHRIVLRHRSNCNPVPTRLPYRRSKPVARRFWRSN